MNDQPKPVLKFPTPKPPAKPPDPAIWEKLKDVGRTVFGIVYDEDKANK